MWTMRDLRFPRRWLLRMPSSGVLRRMALVRTDVSEERSAFIIRVTRIGELGTTIAVTYNRRTLRRNTNILVTWWRRRYVTSKHRFLTRATQPNIPEDGILHSSQYLQFLHHTNHNQAVTEKPARRRYCGSRLCIVSTDLPFETQHYGYWTLCPFSHGAYSVSPIVRATTCFSGDTD
jgi:hypothetical protein